MPTAQDIIKRAVGYIGLNEGDGSFKPILDIYNSHRPLARNYLVKSTDEWCATFVSAVFIKENATHLLGGTECSCQRFIDIFKKKGIWHEDGTVHPRPGDVILYNWDDGTQPNDGWADHIGIVIESTNTSIVVVEGNMKGGKVGKRNITIGWGYIRGYGRPKYDTPSQSTPPKIKPKTVAEVAREVINGEWGNGAERRERLKKAGYNVFEVQKAVNYYLSQITR